MVIDYLFHFLYDEMIDKKKKSLLFIILKAHQKIKIKINFFLFFDMTTC